MHIPGNAAEIFLVILLDHHTFGSPYPCDPFVVRAGDLGIDLPHPPVPVKDLILEINSQNRNAGHDQHNDQRQFPVEHKHDHNIDKRPEHIHQSPGDHARNLQGITHDPGMDISHRSCIIIGKGQCLQMLKLRLFQVLPHIHLNGGGRVDRDIHGYRLGHDHGCIDQSKDMQSL